MTLDELRDVMADAIKYERDTRPYPLADAAIAAMKSAGLVIGERAMLTTADFEAWTMEWQDKDTGISEWFSEMPNGLALVRMIPNE